MWEFAAFMQYLWFFGKAVKVDDVDVEVCCRNARRARVT
jgi:hypothetical protein